MSKNFDGFLARSAMETTGKEVIKKIKKSGGAMNDSHISNYEKNSQVLGDYYVVVGTYLFKGNQVFGKKISQKICSMGGVSNHYRRVFLDNLMSFVLKTKEAKAFWKEFSRKKGATSKETQENLLKKTEEILTKNSQALIETGKILQESKIAPNTEDNFANENFLEGWLKSQGKRGEKLQ